jgi:hypothetical protein
MLVAVASTAVADIGWAGGIWPVNGTSYTSNDNIDVYVKVWKDGCTNLYSPCPDIECYLYYRCSGTADPFTEVTMVFNVDAGNDDEFVGTIPNTHGCDEVEFYVRVHDTTGGDDWYPQDQNNNDPNFFLPITGVTSEDVLVTFTVCIPEGSLGDVCVTGSDPALTGWSQPGLYMSQPCPNESPNLYQTTVLFPLGSNPSVSYKYQKDDCANWDCDPNHTFVIDDTPPYYQVLPLDTWCWGTPDCPECPSPVEDATWGVIKGLYR